MCTVACSNGLACSDDLTCSDDLSSHVHLMLA